MNTSILQRCQFFLRHKDLKKMSVLKISSQPLQCGSTVTQSMGVQSCVQFYPAVLKFSPSQSLGWHIEYYAGSDKGAKLVRYRVRLNLVIS